MDSCLVRVRWNFEGGLASFLTTSDPWLVKLVVDFSILVWVGRSVTCPLLIYRGVVELTSLSENPPASDSMENVS